MLIGHVPNPLKWARWEQAKAYLEPALERADEQENVLEDHHILFAVLDGDDFLACATARMTEDDSCEVVLVGGRDRKRWLAELDQAIGREAAEAGATRMLAHGRRGWLRELSALGWDSLGEVSGATAYYRNLNESRANLPGRASGEEDK